MVLECSVLGRDIGITDLTIPVISPYWRLKRNGDWSLLCRYEHEQTDYSLLSPITGSILSLMDGRLTFRHLCVIIQFAQNLESLDKAREILTDVILTTNRESDVIVHMTPDLEPYVPKMDPYHFVGTALKDEQTRPAAPISLNLMFSNNCENNCAYCYLHWRPVPDSQLLPTKRWKELIQEAKSLGIEQVTLSGGDPLLRKDALSLIGELIKQDMLFVLSTKCYITPEIADRLVDIGMTNTINQYIREIQISVDGPDEHTADKLAGSPGYYSRAVESIRNLVERGFNLRVKAVVTPLNARHIYQWIQKLAQLGVRKVTIAAYNKTFNRHSDNLLLSLQDRLVIADQCELAREDFPEVELRLTGLEIEPPAEISVIDVTPSEDAGPALRGLALDKDEVVIQWKERCGGRSSMTITSDGKVLLGGTVPHNENLLVGDVSRQSIIEVWNSETLRNFPYPPREKFAGSACYDCKDLEECIGKSGTCFRDTTFKYGGILSPPSKCPLNQYGVMPSSTS